MTGQLLTLHHPARTRAFYDAGHWRSDTFADLIAGHARQRGDMVAVRDGSRSVTWSELQTWVANVGMKLRASGVGSGDRVCLLMSNRLEGVVTVLACAGEGFVANPSLHRNYTSSEVVQLVNSVQARALLAETGWSADPSTSDPLAESLAVESLTVRWRLPAGRTVGNDFPDFDTAECQRSQLNRLSEADPDRVCYIAFTSGTTGVPKAVMHSENTLLANARDLVADWGLDDKSVILPLSPISHHIFWVAMSQALVSGATLVLNDPPAGSVALDWIVETGATYVLGVPTHAIDILAEQRTRGMARLGSVETFYMAGAAIPPTVARAFLDQGIKPQNVYGMTENSSHNYTRPDDDADTICATNGHPGSCYEVRIFDPADRDREVEPLAIGEIGGRGACLTLGYFANQRATEESFNEGGWFMSGDLGRLDARGNLLFAGRSKDLIIRGGHNIYPARIEDLAVTHPEINKAAAVPVPDERLGEKVCLVMLVEGDAPPADDVLNHLLARGLSKYDMPEYIVAVDRLPTTASGKVLKRELVEMINDGRILPAPCRLLRQETT